MKNAIEIKSQAVLAVEAKNELAAACISVHESRHDAQVLNDDLLALASGGEAAVCW